MEDVDLQPAIRTLTDLVGKLLQVFGLGARFDDLAVHLQLDRLGRREHAGQRERSASKNFIKLSLLQKAHCVGGFLRREAKAEGAGGHFWHDAVTKPNIITPAP